MQTARTLLKQYVKRNHDGVVQQFADAHGLSRPLVSMWMKGTRRPGWVNAARLQSITGIRAEAWRSAAERRVLESL